MNGAELPEGELVVEERVKEPVSRSSSRSSWTPSLRLACRTSGQPRTVDPRCSSEFNGEQSSPQDRRRFNHLLIERHRRAYLSGITYGMALLFTQISVSSETCVADIHLSVLLLFLP